MLVEDPDLGELLDDRRRAAAERAVIARELRLAPGELSWEESFEQPLLGLLVLEGLLGVRTQIPGRAHLELLGPGDVVVPWMPLVDDSTPSNVTWCALARARLAVLDRGFCLSIRGLPEIHAALAERYVLRARRLAFQLAVNALRAVEERVLLTLWQLGDRWGRVTPDGIRLSLPLTHRDLAEVVGASRPSTTSALMKLRRDGRIELRRGGWLLCGSPPARWHELKARAAA